jgi:tetratricopeptide (TPR) repeat protein
MRHITRFRENHPVHSEAALLEGAILGQLGDDTEDALAYEQALALFEESALPESRQFSAITLARLGRWEEALNAAVSLNAEAQSLVVRAALVAALQGEGLEAAYAAARLVSDRIGASPLAQSLLALQQSAADPDAARAQLIHAIGPYRSDDEAVIATVAWIAAGQPGPAVSQLQRVLAEHGATPTRLILLAQAAVAARFDDEAMNALTRLATLDDSHAVLAKTFLTLLRRAAGEAESASEAIAIDANTASALTSRSPDPDDQTRVAKLLPHHWGALDSFVSPRSQ